MLEVRRTALANQDAIEIWAYIAAENKVAADKAIDKSDQRINVIPRLPHSRPEMLNIAPGARRTVVGRYSIYYRVIDEAIDVLRILHERKNHDDLV